MEYNVLHHHILVIDGEQNFVYVSPVIYGVSVPVVVHTRQTVVELLTCCLNICRNSCAMNVGWVQLNVVVGCSSESFGVKVASCSHWSLSDSMADRLL